MRLIKVGRYGDIRFETGEKNPTASLTVMPQLLTIAGSAGTCIEALQVACRGVLHLFVSDAQKEVGSWKVFAYSAAKDLSTAARFS